jgi:hypothetical protein
MKLGTAIAVRTIDTSITIISSSVVKPRSEFLIEDIFFHHPRLDIVMVENSCSGVSAIAVP